MAHSFFDVRTRGTGRVLRRASVLAVAAATPLLLVAPSSSAQGSSIPELGGIPQLPQVELPQLPQLPEIPTVAQIQGQIVQAVLNALGGMPSIPGLGSPADLAAGSLGVGGGSPVSPGSPSQTDPAAMSREVFDATNAYRQRLGVGTLAWNQHAADLATAHAQHLSQVGGVAHNQGALNEGMGENIAASSDPCNAQCFVTLWDNSPGHQINLRDPQYRGLGVGVAVNNGRVWVVQDFTY